MYPLKFEPYLRTMVWGGEKIAPFKGIKTDQEKIGESWEISGVEGHVSTIANGPLKGRSLQDVIHEYGAELVGSKVRAKFGDEFPLLIKFIDAKEDLSIQVHPSDELAAKTHQGMLGKTEMWYVIGADKGAHLLSGLTKEITPDEYEARVHNNTITDVLARHEIKPGDVYYLPAGRIHAICKGAFVAEIQETSDLTYRIYDYGRLGLDGKPRELHIEQAKEAIDYKVYPSYKTEYSEIFDAETPLVKCKYFTTNLYDLDKGYTKDLSSLDCFFIVICVKGSGRIIDTEADGSIFNEPVHQGQTILIPASSKSLRLEPDAGDRMTCLGSCIE
jgi:mannose-6-phosphate isomerase